MRKIKIEKTDIVESKVKFQGDPEKKLDYRDLIEISLDVVPQGGFTPKDIRGRNRIQDALDNTKTDTINIEDSDYEALEKIVKESRWTLRSPDLHRFLQNFEDSIYKTKPSGK